MKGGEAMMAKLFCGSIHNWNSFFFSSLALYKFKTKDDPFQTECLYLY